MQWLRATSPIHQYKHVTEGGGHQHRALYRFTPPPPALQHSTEDRVYHMVTTTLSLQWVPAKLGLAKYILQQTTEYVDSLLLHGYSPLSVKHTSDRDSGISVAGKSRKITEITENHGKSRKRKLKFLLFAIIVPGRHGKSRKITETEMKVPIVCHCCSWLLSVRVCISLCVFSCDMSSSDENGTPAAKKRKVWQRGSKMSARVRAQQFPGIMEARGDEMSCIPCGQRIDHKEKSTASKHVNYSAEHQRQVERMEKPCHRRGNRAVI